MRLTEFEVKSIVQIFNAHFGTGDIYLFGSRVDDRLKGGDIDLYIDTQDSDDLFEKKLRFMRDLKVKIGEQKVDVVISSDKERSIEKEELKTIISKGMPNGIDRVARESIFYTL